MNLSANQADIVYRVNEQDEVVYVNENWDQFANHNDGEGALSQQVLNRPLMDFISDKTTRELYRQILKRIRNGRTVDFRLRCDSPACRRLLQMSIYPAEGNLVEFRTQVLSAEDRKPVNLKRVSDSQVDLLCVCGWCQKVCVDDDWVDLEAAIEILELLHRADVPGMTHGICEPCFSTMAASLSGSEF